MRAARMTAGALGVALMGIGAFILFTNERVREPWAAVVWLAGSVVAHDGLIAPLVLGVGLLLALLPVSRGAKGVVRGGLLVAALLTAVALPVLLRPGTPKASVLPLDYPRNWLITLAATAALTAALLLVRALRGRERGRGRGAGRRAGHAERRRAD
ncbi:hypothetical protein [Streptomyces sp. H27-D2]|uniref:hypothetical protein n=1 Tax=Streptomyces sp. H27-D2 TaxID=3046304 RepID=UPI002DB7BA60|nr:hypothetical protein [Streptomyces sp. H27-D2]MEC4017901.1 hypothetical protein [Streptomyces sp. H27-D2]